MLSIQLTLMLFIRHDLHSFITIYSLGLMAIGESGLKFISHWDESRKSIKTKNNLSENYRYVSYMVLWSASLWYVVQCCKHWLNSKVWKLQKRQNMRWMGLIYTRDAVRLKSNLPRLLIYFDFIFKITKNFQRNCLMDYFIYIFGKTVSVFLLCSRLQ